MKKRTVIVSILLSLSAAAYSFASEEDRSSSKARAREVFEKTVEQYGSDVMVVKACDDRKKVVVEGYKKGEIMPREKAAQTAKLLNRLMEYCDEEFVAVIPRNRIEILLSLNGEPFITVDDTDLRLPMTLAHGGQEHTKRERQVWKAEEDNLIATGYKLFHSQLTGTNGISCDMCHPDASNTHPETYPKFQTQLKKVALLRDMINWCIEKPLEGKTLSGDDETMKALEAYILSTRKGTAIDYGKH